MAVQEVTKPMAKDETLQATNTALALLGKDTTLQAIVTALASIGVNTVGNLASLTTTDKTSLVAAVNELNTNKVEKETGKGLSTNDYTTAEKNKLSGIATGATKTEASTTNGNIKIDGTETQVYDDSDIQDKIDETTTSISGNPISISGLKANQLAVNPIITLEPIQDLHGQSKPYPAGGGKNKLAYTVSNLKTWNTSGTWNDNVYTYNGVTYTILTDNGNNVIGIRVNGTANPSSGLKLSDTMNNYLTDGIQYVLNGCPSGGSTSTYYFCIGTSFDSSRNAVDTGAGVSLNYSVSTHGEKSAYIGLLTNTSVSNVTFLPMIVPVSVTDRTFAPTSNICPISGYDKIEVLSSGANVWNEEWEVGSIDNETGQNDDHDNYNIRQKDYTMVNPNQAYFFKCASKSLRLYWYDANYNFISTDVASTVGTPKTSPTNARYFRIRTTSSYGSTYLNDIMVNVGNSGVDYQPYVKITSISESLGQTVYWGELDVRSGKFKVLGGRVDLGSIDWDIVESASAYKDFRNISMANVIKPVDSQAIANGACEIFAMTSRNDQANNHPLNTIAITLNGYIRVIANASYTDATAFKTDMSGVYFVYELATPFYIQLTPHEISLLKDYAYVSTNGTSIALDYHNGELASLSDVNQLNETIKNQFSLFDSKQFKYVNGVIKRGTTITLDVPKAYLLITYATVGAALAVVIGNGYGKESSRHKITQVIQPGSGLAFAQSTEKLGLVITSTLSGVDVSYRLYTLVP